MIKVQTDINRCYNFKNYENILRFKNKKWKKRSPSFSIKIRRTLMGLYGCIRRYASHIEALKSDAKLQDMPRITYNE